MELKTVKDLKDALNKIEDDSQPIEIAIKQANKVYPVAYVPIDANTWGTFDSNGSKFRIYAHLPSDDKTFMITSKRKSL